MSYLIEQLIARTLNINLINFELNHFHVRSVERNLAVDFVKDLILNHEVLHYRKSRGYKKGYEFFYKHPFIKEYGEIKVCIQLFDGCVNVMTVYEEKLNASGSRRKSLKYPKMSNEFELQEKLLRNARY